ncbi:MAG TPA: sulfatase-like hydrolase/transferase [Bryobacteraceae bacterium]|jgi:arylsulfatase A-like enzyme
MNRRSFLSTVGLGAAAVAQDVAQRIESPSVHPSLRYINPKTGAHPFTAGIPSKRPHIFLITLDMVSPEHYHPSRAFHREMNLPAIHSLRSDSAVFTNSFCTAPVCAPARASLATGRYSYITANGERAHDGHETILRASDVIFQEYLKATGYTTKHAGKGHLGTQKFMDAFDENDNAWDRWAPPIYDDELYLAYLRRLGVRQQRYRREIFTTQQDRKTPGFSLGGWIEQSDGKPFPMEAQYTHFLVDRAIQKLDAALADSPDKPVYLQLDIFDPHQPFSIPAGLEEREKLLLGAAGRLPESYRDMGRRNWETVPLQPKIYEFYRRNWGMYDPANLRAYRTAAALQMEVVDLALAKFFRALVQRNLYQDSIVILTSDHGEMNGHHALVDKGVYLYPDVLRVPLMVKMPGMSPGQVEEPVSHLDIAPTLLGVAGVEPMERLDGRSLLPYLKREVTNGDRDLLFECGWHTGVNFACATQRWTRGGEHHLYSYNCSDRYDELYDLHSTDADNLAARDDSKKVKSEMIGRLGAFLQKDARWRGYYSSFSVDHYWDLPRPKGDVQMFRPV